MATDNLFTRILVCVVMTWSRLRDTLWATGTTVPEPGFILGLFLAVMFGQNDLKKLEFLSEYFFSSGLFRFRDKVYIIDAKYCHTVINKLDKGAEKYLSNSPLRNSFLGSSNRSPDVRRSIAAIFRKSNMEQKGLVMIQDMEKAVRYISMSKTINVNTVALKLALDVVGHVLLDLDLGAIDGRQDLNLECMMTILHRAYALGEIDFNSTEFAKAGQQFDRLTSKILEDALSSDDSHTNLPRLLYGACGFEEAKDNLKLFLMAGSETTAATIPIVLHVLAEHPRIQEELQKEADEFLAQLKLTPGAEPPRLEMCLKEMFRLYPIAPYISRHTESGLTLGHVHIPKQTDLRIFIWGIHRSPFLWEDSKHFRSERFSKSDLSANYQSSLWTPFGAGSRICIGQHLAWVELRLALSYLLHHFTFSLIPETSDLHFCVDWEHAVVHPTKDVILGVEKRNQ